MTTRRMFLIDSSVLAALATVPAAGRLIPAPTPSTPLDLGAIAAMAAAGKSVDGILTMRGRDATGQLPEQIVARLLVIQTGEGWQLQLHDIPVDDAAADARPDFAAVLDALPSLRVHLLSD